jgi:diguanylate cyclase (GGDEF)-like protein
MTQPLAMSCETARPASDGVPPAWAPWVLAQLQVGIIVLDGADRVVFVNDWFLQRSGYQASDMLQRRLVDVCEATPNFFKRLALAQTTGFPAMLSHSLHSPPLPLYMPHLVGHPPAILSQTVHIVPMGRRSGQGEGYTLIQATDVTPTVRRESLLRTRVDQMHLMARIDPLTGVGNRRAFTESLESEVRAAIRAQGPLGLLMLDIDHFKLYNDHYGHPAGDQCLREVAALLQRVIRRPRDRLARYGGEEFAILLPGTPMEGVLEVGRDVVNQVRQLGLPHAARPHGDVVTVSVGATAVYPTQLDDASVLLTQADQALYEAKAGGRDRLCHHRSIASSLV